MEPEDFLKAMGRSLKETRSPEVSPDYRMRSSDKRPGPLGTNTEPSVEELSRAAMASRGPLTRGDGDMSSSLHEQATKGHSRPNWQQKVSDDGTQV